MLVNAIKLAQSVDYWESPHFCIKILESELPMYTNNLKFCALYSLYKYCNYKMHIKLTISIPKEYGQGSLDGTISRYILCRYLTPIGEAFMLYHSRTIHKDEKMMKWN